MVAIGSWCRWIGRRAQILLICIPAPGLAVQVSGAEPVEVHWVVEQRELPFTGWRQNIVYHPRSGVWLGGIGESGRNLLRLAADGGLDDAEVQLASERSYVLDFDPTGVLWVANYPAVEEEVYRGFLLYRRGLDGTWTQRKIAPGSLPRLSIWPQAIAMVSATEGWLVGNNGLMVHLHEGRLRKMELPQAVEDENFHAIEMTGPEHGWAVGTQGLVARYENGFWDRVEVPAELDEWVFQGLDMDSQGDLWVVGVAGLVARYRRGQWRRFPTAVKSNLRAIHMLSPTSGWAVGAEGMILRFTGESWAPQPSPVSSHLSDIVMISESEGWIVGLDAVLRAQVQEPLFREATASARYRQLQGMASQVTVLHLDRDGRVDLARVEPSGVALYFDRDLGAGERIFDRVELPGWGANVPLNTVHAMAWGDAEGDGDMDLLMLAAASVGGVQLYLNGGDGVLSAARNGVLDQAGSSRGDTAHWIDFAGDDALDIYWSRSRTPQIGSQENELYVQDGEGVFVLSKGHGGERGIEYFVLPGDLDGDGDVDFVVPGYGAGELSLLLNAEGELVDRTEASGLAAATFDGRVAQGELADLDLDGDLDLLLCADRLLFFRNNGRARFSQIELFESSVHCSISAFSANGRMTADLDQDGRLEIMVNSVVDQHPALRVFAAGERGPFRDATRRLGLADLRGDSWTVDDLDGDGDLDLQLIGNISGGANRVLINSSDGTGFLGLRLRATAANRQAVGAMVKVYEAGYPGEVEFLRAYGQHGVGLAAGGAGAAEMLIPVAPGALYDLEVTFPGGRRELVQRVASGSWLTIYEGPLSQRLKYALTAAKKRLWQHLDWRWAPLFFAAVIGLWVLWHRLLPEFWAPRRRLGWLLAGAPPTAACLAAMAGLAAAGDPAAWRWPLAVLAVVFLLALAGAGWVRRRRGDRRFGPYLLRALLGEGAMGTVHQAVDLRSGRPLAVKLLLSGRLPRLEDRVRMLREAELLARLEHPQVVRVIDAGAIKGQVFLAMELLEGESLAQRLARAGPLPSATVLRLLGDAAEGLAYVHRCGIVHRDLKSANLFLAKPLSGTGTSAPAVLKLIDFGLADQVGTPATSEISAAAGTAVYMAPEVLRGATATPCSDLYSLGVVAWQALTGELPRADLAALLSDRPLPALGEPAALMATPLAAILGKLLALDPLHRLASAEELIAALHEIGGGREPALARHQGLALAPVPASLPEAWRRYFDEARGMYSAGRGVAGQARILDCLSAIEELLQSSRAGQAALPNELEVEQILTLQRQLNGVDLNGVDLNTLDQGGVR